MSLRFVSFTCRIRTTKFRPSFRFEKEGTDDRRERGGERLYRNLPLSFHLEPSKSIITGRSINFSACTWLDRVSKRGRSLARSFTCLSLEVLSLINPYRNGVTALVSLLASHFLPPSLPSRCRFCLLWLYFLNSSPHARHPGMAKHRISGACGRIAPRVACSSFRNECVPRGMCVAYAFLEHPLAREKRTVSR